MTPYHYQSLLSLSPAADWIGGDREEEEAAVSSYLSLDDDMNGVGEEGSYVVYHPPEPEPEPPQQAPPLCDALQQQGDYCCASSVAGTSSEGEPGKQDASAALISSEPHDNGFFTTSSRAQKGGGGGGKVAFRTRSEVEVLDDGYRWRKYGKKLVKNRPNPRNYYRCSAEGCAVKKRVERARDDASFVITTYDGVHNHPAAPAPHHRLRDYRLFDPPTQGL
ncbi:unnamed protein product [Urochloa humidicola]